MQAKEIKGKIKAVGNIKKITRTMEMVSVAKMRKLSERVAQSYHYARAALRIMAGISRDAYIDHPLTSSNPDAKKVLMLVVGSNKGLCGGYNVNLQKRLRTFIDAERSVHPDSIFETITVGKQAERIVHRFDQVSCGASFVDFSDVLSADEAAGIRKTLMDWYQSGQYRKVVVVSTQFHKPLDYTPSVVQVLPFHPESLREIITRGAVDAKGESPEFAQDKITGVISFEPNEKAVLEEAFPLLLTAAIFQLILEAAAAEHSSRMVAMKAATDNAASFQEELRLAYNKARQAAITTEIAEIVGGAAALSN